MEYLDISKIPDKYHRHAQSVMKGFTTYNIPRQYQQGLLNYLYRGIRPGGWMVCVLANDLRGAIMLCEAGRLEDLRNAVLLLHAEFPDVSWGNEAKVQAWLAKGGLS